MIDVLFGEHFLYLELVVFEIKISTVKNHLLFVVQIIIKISGKYT